MSELPIKPVDSMFTDQQWESVHASGSNLLISASAGSGKTMVLVNRIIEQIKMGVSVDELLVVTFTNAAAKEMKQRIETAIHDEINADPEYETRYHLSQQLPKLGQADISTLHSFCLKVIERYYYLIDFDPVFRLLTDDTEIELIKEDVWNELLEDLYEDADSNFIHFMENYSSSRNDDEVTEMVFSLHEFSRANENPTEWLQSLTNLYKIPSGKLEEAKIFKDYLKIQLIDEIEYMIQLLDQALALANEDEFLEKQINILEEDRTHYKQIRSLLGSNQLEKCYELISQGYKFSTLRGPGKKAPEEVQDLFNNEIKDLRNEAKDAYKKFAGNFSIAPKEQAEMITKTKEHVQTLATLTQQFSEEYQRHKAERKLIDFNDLEHLTLQILRDETTGGASEASTYYRNKFHEVLVDEYQDINALQEAILLLLSKSDDEVGNYFMVGDVKQSIYGFRLADPSLFLKKYEHYDTTDNGKRIILAENFRSRQNVLSFTNYIFTQLMDHEVGNLAYDKNAELVFGNKDFEENNLFDSELLIYENKQKDTEDTIDFEDTDEFQINRKTTGEILMVASRIQELINDGFEIYDKNQKVMRPLEYKDIVLLTPTKTNNLEIQEIFRELGIPSAINETQNFFQTTEVTIMMSLLQVIDNPRQDIPFVAALRSPIVNLNEVELTYIRLQDRQADFYDATLAYSEAEFEDSRNINTQRKVADFLKNLDRWREYARRHSVVELLRLLYEETGYLQYVGGMSGGKQRRANLEALYERAASYESTSFKGLYRFIRFIDKMQEKDKDLAEPTSILSEQNAVRVMTIHASKGLEFPIVFLMDLSKKFNRSDWTGAYIFDRELGVGLEFRDADKRVKSSTMVDTVIKNIKKQNGYAEQMRLLYVALTRAEQKLFLVGTMESEEKAFETWDKGNSGAKYLLPANLRLKTNNFMDWIGLAIARHQITADKVNSIQENKAIRNYPVTFSYKFYSGEELTSKLQNKEQIEEKEWLKNLMAANTQINTEEDVQETITKAMNIISYEYPYQLSTQTANYQSVSEVKQMFEEPNIEQLAKTDWSSQQRVNRYTENLFERPKFLQEEKPPTAAEIGQATHMILQMLDLSSTPTEEKVDSTIEKLVSEEVLSEVIAAQIDISNIVQYFKTPFGQELVENFAKIQREILFSLSIDAAEIFSGMEEVDDSVLIHGIIDGYFERGEELVLFDYKTDRVRHLGLFAEDELLKRYRGQLLLYKQALETITGKDVTGMYIISLDLLTTIPVTE